MIRTICLLLAALSFAVPSLATPPADAAPFSNALVVKVGYTTFDSPGKPSGLEPVKWYLNEIAKNSLNPPWKRPLQFELVLGNYYQIWSWFKTGQIDAAIVSPFMAMLLERDSQAISVLELAEGRDPAAHFPMVAATGRWKDDPLAGVDQYLADLLEATGEEDLDSRAADVQKIRADFRFDLVSHFSSSGFIMPALYTQSWINSPDRGNLDEDQKGRFWHLFFENAHMTLTHNETHAPLSVSTLKFSYEYSTQEQPTPARLPDFGAWKTYPVGDSSPHGPSIPNDVLLVRRKVADEAIGIAGADPDRLSKQLMPDRIQATFHSHKNWKYHEIRWFNPSVHGEFRRQVSRLFSSEAKNPELARLNTRWFEKGLFDFTVDETMTFLRQDQQDSRVSRLALVLSGGGVKSLYQTVLLDHLYSGQIRNCGTAPVLQSQGSTTDPCDPAPPKALESDLKEPDSKKSDLKKSDSKDSDSKDSGSRDSAEALTVHTIIGTSGGAMLAFFAAQIPEIGVLTKIVTATSAKPLFPNTDLPRLFSLLGMLIVIQLVLLVTKTFNVLGYRNAASKAVQKLAIPGVVAIELLLVVAGAAAIVMTRNESMETVPVVEAAFYVLTGIAVHFGISCISRSGGAPRQETLGKLAWLGLAFGLQLLLVAGAARYLMMPVQESVHGFSLPDLSTLASAGIFLMAAAFVALAAAGCWGLALEGVAEYAAALSAAGTLLGVAFLPLVLLTLAGRGSLLELTGPYWVGALLAALAASVCVLYLASRVHSFRFIHRGLVELIRDRRGVLTTTLATTLIGVFAFCIVCWLGLVAPAVYSNVFAVKAFREALPRKKLWTNHFHSNLIVTGTLLRDQRCSASDVIKAGGLYFCFEGPEGCGGPGGGPWQVFRQPAAARAVDAVFASGSAFPVFPPHQAHLPNGCEVPLVDGGYAHNIPLEAASKADARQVLILNASPDPQDAVLQAQPPWRRLLQQTRLDGGGLVRSSPDVLSFMFERAQELDRNIGESLVVASLSPRPEDGWWPFLLDFRPIVRNKMIDAAEQDIQQERRIGHILSWGRPVFLPREPSTPEKD